MNLRILGVMTGTSCDGLDAACVEVGRDSWNPLWHTSAPYPSGLKKRALAFQKPGSRHSAKDWLELHRDLGLWYASAILKIIKKHRPKPDVIANHGQTLAHFPTKNSNGMTLQLGDPTRIAAATGLTVVSHFREGDMAAGGQGAPLVPLFHQLLGQKLGGGKEGVALHNIGGISNLTYLGPNGKVLGFDTGPGNIWIDEATQAATRGRSRFDKDGRIALENEADHQAVKKILKGKFFNKVPPKSTGRDDFPFSILTSATRGRGPALVATATAVTVESMALAYEKWIIRKGLPLHAIYLCGGGANNKALVKGLQERFPRVHIGDLKKTGFDPQLIEAQAFAMLGFCSLLGRPVGGPWTGARGFGPPGQITPGENWTDVASKLSSAYQYPPTFLGNRSRS